MKFTIKSTAFLLLFCAGVFTAQSQEVSKSFSGIKKIKLTTSSGSCKLVKGSSSNIVR